MGEAQEGIWISINEGDAKNATCDWSWEMYEMWKLCRRLSGWCVLWFGWIGNPSRILWGRLLLLRCMHSGLSDGCDSASISPVCSALVSIWQIKGWNGIELKMSSSSVLILADLSHLPATCPYSWQVIRLNIGRCLCHWHTIATFVRLRFPKSGFSSLRSVKR